MFALADVVHFFAHKLAGLSRWCFALAFRLARPLDRFLLWHNLSSPQP
jgi:hypothetical protein